MKQLILIAGMILAMSAKLAAQDKKGIEVNHFQTAQNEAQKETNQFEIVAHEDVDVNLKFKSNTEDSINIIVTDSGNKTVLTQNIKKPGQNRVKFTMEENEKYLVKMISEKQSNMIVELAGN